MSQHTTAKLLSNGIVIAGLENVLQVEMFDTSYYQNRSFAQIVSKLFQQQWSVPFCSQLAYTPSVSNYKSFQESWRVKPSQSLTKIIEKHKNL